MSTRFHFGRLPASQAAGAPTPRAAGPFRIALLGDFSGRAMRGELRRGDALARCKPIRLDVDTLDRVIAGFGGTLHLRDLTAGGDGTGVDLPLASLDDLHPDRLFETLPLFAELSALRQRLAHPRSFAAAAEELRRWQAEGRVPGGGDGASLGDGRGDGHGGGPGDDHRDGLRGGRPAPTARGSRLPIDARLDDFARLLGRPRTTTAAAPAAIDALLRRVVAPHVVEAASPQAPALIAAVDRAIAAAMRAVLHHPDVQELEAAWRTLDFVARRVETDSRLQVVVYDISAEEFAADLAATDALQDTALYRLLVEEPALDAHQGPLSALIGHYGFEMTPPHAELLGRMARIAARARAPFIASVGRDCLATRPDDLHPLVSAAWKALRELPAARFLMLTVPRFLLRSPYGERAEPVDAFDFEEFDPQAGLKTLLWGHASALAAVLLGQHARRAGPRQAPGASLRLGDMPWFVYPDADGDSVALPCTERLVGERLAAQVHGYGFVPVLAHKGRPEVRLGGFQSLAGPPLAGPWTPVEALPVEDDGPAEALGAAGARGADTAADSATVPGTADAANAANATDGAHAAHAAHAADAPTAEAAADEIVPLDADAELDALLASLNDAAEPPPAPAGGIDPDLAALLADL